MLWALPTQIMALKMRVNLESFWSIVTVCRMNMPKSAVFVWSTMVPCRKTSVQKPARADGLQHDERFRTRNYSLEIKNGHR